MSLNKTRLGRYITESDTRNTENIYGSEAVVGLSTQKQIIKTKANLSGVNFSGYKLFAPGQFAYVPDTSRRGDKIALAYNSTKETFLVSSIYVVFNVSDQVSLLPDYLYMFFNRPEFDRYARFNSWGSARETFNWDDMCDIEISLPPRSIQEKYVDIYNALLVNQQSYERGLDDLKLVCDAYIENLGRTIQSKPIGPYLLESNKRNDINLAVDAVRGLATSKAMIPTKANMTGVSLSNYKIVSPGQIAYVSDTSRRGDKISLGYNDTKETFLVSSISTVFGTDEKKLLPDYLMLFLTRSEFDRYTRFCSWGSARETFDWSEMCGVEIPIPDIEIQRAISDIYKAYIERKRINEQIKSQIRDICPVLIKGSVDEARKET